MQDHALASLRDIGVVAIVCLALEAGLMAPILMIIVLRQLRKVAELRLTLFSLLLAVPRPIALELSQRVVSLGELEDEEDGLSEMDNMVEEGATHQKKALQEGRDKSARRNKVRQLMAIRIPYNRVQTARNNLRLGSKSERGGYKRWIWDLSVAAPFLAWAVIIVIVQSMTWRLQVSTRQIARRCIALVLSLV